MIYINYPKYTDKTICDMVTNLIHSNDYDLQLIIFSRLFEQATFQGKEAIEIKLEVMKILIEALLVDINKILNAKSKK